MAGEEDRELENALGTNVAAALIYAVSRPGVPVPDFFASEEEAMIDIRAGAEK